MKQVRITDGRIGLRRLVGPVLAHRLVKASAGLAAADMLTALLLIPTLALLVQHFGAIEFGYFVVMTTAVTTLAQLTTFQSWQAVVRFSTPLLEDGDRDGLRTLLGRIAFLDAATALVAAALATGLLQALPRVADIPSAIAGGAWFFALFPLTLATGLPLGMLRVHGRFGVLGASKLVVALVRLLGVGLVVLQEGAVVHALLLWLLAETVGAAILWVPTFAWLRRERLRLTLSARHELPQGVWSFLLSSNLHSSVKLGLAEADVLLLSVVAGPAAAGQMRVIKQFGAGVAKLGAPLTQVFYPELVRALTQDDVPRYTRLIRRMNLAAGAVAGAGLVIFFLLGEAILSVLFADQFRSLQNPILVYLLGTVISAATIAYHPALLAQNRARASLSVLVRSSAVYLVLLLLLAKAQGVLGAAIAYAAFYGIWALLIRRALYRPAAASRRIEAE